MYIFSKLNKSLKRDALVFSASLIAVATLSVATLSVATLAQTVPTSVEPGKIEKSLLSPKQQNGPDLAPKARTTSKPSSVAPGGAKDITFVLKDLAVEGSSVYKQAELLKSVKVKVGQEITVAELFDIAATLTARYRNDGYLLSTVIVPPQKINGGKVVLRAVEGYLDRIAVEGITAKQKTKILRYLNKLVGRRPLQSKNLERYLLLVDDLPGVDLKTFLQPSAENGGAATLTLKPKVKRFNVWSSADNRGSDFVGPYKLALGGVVNAPVSLGQSISAQVATAPGDKRSDFDELKYVNLSLAQELGYEGTSVSFSASGMLSQPGEELTALELKSKSLSFDLAVRAKPYRSRDANLYLSFGATFKEGYTEALGFDLSEDRARQLKFAVDFQSIDRLLGANSFSFGVNQGLDVLGATPNNKALQSRFDARHDATWFNLDFSRVQSLAKLIRPGFDLSVSVASQVSLNPLSAAREFSVGGLAHGSAYDSSEISGDHGVSGRLEFRYATTLGGVPKPNEAWRAFALQVYAFGDGGTVWQFTEGDQERSNGQINSHILSAGVGARFNLGSHTSATFEVANPFDNVASQGNKDPRMFFSLTNRF